jgi:hypothetical protein
MGCTRCAHLHAAHHSARYSAAAFVLAVLAAMHAQHTYCDAMVSQLWPWFGCTPFAATSTHELEWSFCHLQ